MRPPKRDPTKLLNPEASHTNVSEKTPGDRVNVHALGPSQELLELNGTRTSLPAEPSPNDAGPIVRHPIGLKVEPS